NAASHSRIHDLEQKQAESMAGVGDQSSLDLASVQASPSWIVSKTLGSNLSRGAPTGMPNEILIPSGPGLITLSLLLQDDADRSGYTVVVKTPEGDEVARVERRRSVFKAGSGNVVQVGL